MKISFISVFPPYRGGISTHSSLILNELLKKYDVQGINFKKLYPKIFFPGKSQYDDIKNSIGKRILDSTNILSWEKTLTQINKFTPDLVLVKFWHPFFIPCYHYIIKRLKKKHNCKIIMIFDNIFPHESFPFSKILLKKMLINIDAFIVQSSNTRL